MGKCFNLLRICYLSSARECERGTVGVLGTHPAKLPYKLCNRLQVWGGVGRPGTYQAALEHRRTSQSRSGSRVCCKLARVNWTSAQDVGPGLSVKAGYGMHRLASSDSPDWSGAQEVGPC